MSCFFGDVLGKANCPILSHIEERSYRRDAKEREWRSM